MRRLLALSAAFILAPALFAQEPETPPVFTSQAELVVVDVLVSDGAGRPVRGLTREHVAVTEDGAPRAIASFEAIDLPDAVPSAAETAAAAPTAGTANPVRPDRAIVVVVFDEQHLSPITVEQVRRRLDRVWPAMGTCDVLLLSTANAGPSRGRLADDAQGLPAALARLQR